MSNLATPDSAEVLIVGSFVLDHVWQTDRFPQPGETRRGLGFMTGPGGKGFNQAVACRRQEGKVLFVGAIGTDSAGAQAEALARTEGLACAWQIVPDRPTATAGILVDAEGRNQIIVHLAANEALAPDFVSAQIQSQGRARVLLTQLENTLPGVRAALACGRAQGLLCMLNPAPMHADCDADLLALCDVITPNETEFALLIERILGERIDAARIAACADADLHTLCRRLGVPSVVITLGAAGCFVSHGEGNWRGDARAYYRQAAEVVHAIDTTAAGDAFSGALAAALANPDLGEFAAAVRAAGRVAALSTESLGAAASIPTRAAVAARFGVNAGDVGATGAS